MFPLRPLPAAMGTTAVVAVALSLVWDFVPGEEIMQLLNFLLVALLALSLLPALALVWAARRTEVQSPLALATWMAGAQAAILVPVSPLPFTIAYWLFNYFPGMHEEVIVSVLIVVFTILVFALTPFSAWVALALTGNLRRVNVIERE